MTVRRRRSMGVTLLGIIAGLVFMAGLIVHISTFLPSPTVSMDVVWPIGIGVFINAGQHLVWGPWRAVIYRRGGG